jgi:hypothetical protein
LFEYFTLFVLRMGVGSKRLLFTVVFWEGGDWFLGVCCCFLCSVFGAVGVLVECCYCFGVLGCIVYFCFCFLCGCCVPTLSFVLCCCFVLRICSIDGIKFIDWICTKSNLILQPQAMTYGSGAYLPTLSNCKLSYASYDLWSRIKATESYILLLQNIYFHNTFTQFWINFLKL